MRFTETEIPGAFVVDPEQVADERGFFARTWTAAEFVDRGLDPTIAQCSISWNRTKGTLRGLHFQREPFGEVKLVRCTRGAIADVVVDLRRGSPAFRKWTLVELSHDNRRMLYIPKGLAHGFVTLTDDTEVSYQLSALYSAAHTGGVRWDDPAFAIEWPAQPAVMSARDRDFPDFDPSQALD